MKKIIDGKIYNTETAKEIAAYSNSYGSGDFNWLSETLYITKSGKYFIAGEGGAFTKYSVSYGNTTGGGDGLKIVSKSEALEWCEDRDIEVDTVTKHFQIEEA